MTPALVISGLLSGVRAILAFVPSAPKVVGDILHGLRDLPEAVDELADGEWEREDVLALGSVVGDTLDEAPSIPTWHAKHIGLGAAAATDLIVSAVRKTAPVGGRRLREKIDKARANALPAVDGRGVPR